MKKRHYRKISNPTVIKNAVTIRSDAKLWKYSGQKRAILISRIFKDKLRSIECFIKYCRKNHIEFDIAGEELFRSGLKKFLQQKFKLSPEQFLGNVNTVEFLEKNEEKYLFVAGVGLVILEAASLNYPCFVCSDYNGQNYSFVTKENVMYFDNFTIQSYHEINRRNKKKHG